MTFIEFMNSFWALPTIVFGLPTAFFLLALIIGPLVNKKGFCDKVAKTIEKLDEVTEEQKEQMAFKEARHKMYLAQEHIARIYKLHQTFYEREDPYVGKMTVCGELDELPTYLKAFKCSMEKRHWDRPEDDEVINVIIFARDIESVIDYINCYQLKDSDATGFEYGRVNYLYDGMCPLQECQDLMHDIKYSSAAFVIDKYTGWDFKKKEREAAQDAA